MPHITNVEARPNCRIYCKLSDGTDGEIDMSNELWGPVFEPLRAPALFAQVHLDECSMVVWPTGASLAPEFIAEKLGANDVREHPLSAGLQETPGDSLHSPRPR